MPSRRFWSMESQIARIQASEELRSVRNSIATNNNEAMKDTIERLTLEIGEPFRIKREHMVAPERDAKAKFASVM